MIIFPIIFIFLLLLLSCKNHACVKSWSRYGNKKTYTIEQKSTNHVFNFWIELACMQTISVKINVEWLRFSQVVWATMLRFISCKIIFSCKTSQIRAWILSLEYRSKFNNQLMVRRCYILCGCKHKNSNCQNKVVSMLYKCSHIVGYKILRLSFELRSFTILSNFSISPYFKPLH